MIDLQGFKNLEGLKTTKQIKNKQMKKNVWIQGNPKPQKLDNSKKMAMLKEVESFIINFLIPYLAPNRTTLELKQT